MKTVTRGVIRGKTIELAHETGLPEGQEVMITLETAARYQPWPPGYFDNTYGSIDDDTFFRHPQGELPTAVELD
jgi:hypothetical protein